jgi:hypothetical protein
MNSGGATGSGGEMALPLYGAPFIPPDAGSDAAADAAPTGAGGSFAALYGAAPGNIYGAPPAPAKP